MAAAARSMRLHHASRSAAHPSSWKWWARFGASTPKFSCKHTDAIEAFYLATLGGARALALDERLGALAPGREADIVVLDPNATALMAFRNRRVQSIEEQLAVLMTLGDDRTLRATYIAGALAHERSAGGPEQRGVRA